MTSFPDILRILQVVFGIGLVIFVHELGHFLAARWCKVRVDVFSLGFGPRLFGWRHGDTLYQIAAVPVGGYVRMAGDDGYAEDFGAFHQVEGREPGEETTFPFDAGPAPDDLRSKSVGQRFFIYSGGVLMNLAFAMVVFPILFQVGVSFIRPQIDVIPGGPAWQAGLASGTEVLAVNGKDVYEFNHIRSAVALGNPNRTELLVREPGSSEPRTVRLTPTRDESLGFNRIDVVPATDPEERLVVDPESAAARAGLETGDRLLAVEGGLPGLPASSQLSLAVQGGAAVTLTVDREGTAKTVTVEPDESSTVGRRLLGVQPLRRLVLAVRKNRDAQALGLQEGDLLVRLGDHPIQSLGDFRRALLDAPSEARELQLERAGELLSLSLPALDTERALDLADDVALGDDSDSNAVTIMPGTACAAAGLRDGDRILSLDGRPCGAFEDITEGLRRTGRQEDDPVVLEVGRRGPDGADERLTFEVVPQPRRFPVYGLDLPVSMYVFQADGPVHAVEVGVTASWRFLEDTYMTLKRMLLGEVSVENLGGIIAISKVSYDFAGLGWVKLFFFLCMLSINLAFLNVLPIPVLDGGHLFFLIVEKLKGSPVSERVLGYSQMIGLVLILSLMVFVTYNDFVRWILGPANS